MLRHVPRHAACGTDGQPSTYKGWKAHVLENDLVRLHVVPDIGGRVIQYRLGRQGVLLGQSGLTGKTSPETGLDAGRRLVELRRRQALAGAARLGQRPSNGRGRPTPCSTASPIASKRTAIRMASG